MILADHRTWPELATVLLSVAISFTLIGAALLIIRRGGGHVLGQLAAAALALAAVAGWMTIGASNGYRVCGTGFVLEDADATCWAAWRARWVVVTAVYAPIGAGIVVLWLGVRRLAIQQEAEQAAHPPPG